MREKIAEIYGKRRYGVWWEGVEQRLEARNFADNILALFNAEIAEKNRQIDESHREQRATAHEADKMEKEIEKLKDLGRLRLIDIKSLEERNDRLEEIIEGDSKEIVKLKEGLAQCKDTLGYRSKY